MQAGRRRERKVVSVLFCDLVGFTSHAETLDPEDVEAMLRPYHARVREELERHGGTVEKFIGDAVMALFGAPTAHEDDAERAVRSALAIREFALEEELELRVGITTGEALVSLDARPAEGEGMASGDVVNTAARLQSAAPVNGVLVDGTTYRATRHVVEYQPAQAVEAKGKAKPVEVWLAEQARSRFGVDVAHEARAPLVGRERELSAARDSFERARHDRTPQLLTLVGVPGIGKSRLVYELSRIADDDPELITWRQGRCLAYGDGVTLWALGEIVKAQAGIVEQDSPADVESKVRQAASEVLANPSDEGWVASHLLALVGLGEETELVGDHRGEAFAAWRRFLEALAEQRPLVLVFEDLHWADESLLDFVDELVDWVSEVPLLAVCTARPELLERRPGWGGGKLNATTLALQPLSDEQTATLISQLLAKPLLVAESQQALLERAGGNPLYAEQFADLFLERGSAEELPLPETLQGIIAARLDGLSESEKGLLQDASVVGKVFWASALRTNGDDPLTALHTLERKGFVRRQKRSSLEGESEFAFAHALVRDVAYGQIARSDRAAKHRRMAEWIEGLGRDEDHAEMVAHHWRSALELEHAAGSADGELVTRVRQALRSAGDRAFGLNSFEIAARYFAEALALSSVEDEDHALLLFQRARALHLADDDAREGALHQARDALLAVGRIEEAAEAEAFLSNALWYRGQRDEADVRLRNAQKLLEGRGPSRAKARVLSFSARLAMLAGHSDEALRVAGEALALAEELSLDELRAHSLTTIGSTVQDLDVGREHLERAVEIALAANSPIASAVVNNLAVLSWRSGDVTRADELYAEAKAVAERMGDQTGLRWSRGNLIGTAYVRGRWDQAEQAAEEFIEECRASPHYMEHAALDIRGLIRMGRGDAPSALEDWTRAVAIGRAAKDPQALLPTLLHHARGSAQLGRIDEARTLAREAFTIVEEHPEFAGLLTMIAANAVRLGVADQMLELVEGADESDPWADAARAGAQGDVARLAEFFDSAGAVAPAAETRLVHAERLAAEGRLTEAQSEAERALAFYRSVGATFYVERGERLLAKTA